MHRCENCIYFSNLSAMCDGLCRRYPPIPAKDGFGRVYPLMKQKDWCGEYEYDELEVLVGEDVQGEAE